MKKDGKESLFTIQDGVLLKYIGKEPDVVIPDEVTEIATNAFWRRNYAKSIVIPPSVKKLQPYALAECKSLEKLVIQADTQIIPEGLCNSCANLKEVDLLSGITEIGEKAFNNCISLKEIDLSKGITTIGASAFYNCPFFHITIPESIKVIEDSAFRGAPIQEIELPEGLESIGWSAFEGSLLKEIIVPKSCKLLGDSFCVSEQLKKAVILSDDVKPKPLSASSIQGEEFLTSLFFSRQVDERVRKKLKIDVYCNETVKKRLPKCWHGNCKPLSDWNAGNTEQKDDKGSLEAVKVYALSDEQLKKLLSADDPVKALEKRKFPKKSKYEVETPQGVITVTNQAHTDIKRALNDSSYYEYCDMYVAMEHFLSTEEVEERIKLADPGQHSDAAYYATPEIDWDAPKLSAEQKALRFLLLAKAADTFLQGEYLKEIVAAMPKKKNGTLMKNRVTRIASGNMVTKEAKVLELAAKADSDTSIVLFADFRAFSQEELALLENDYLSTHVSALGLNLAEAKLQEKKEKPKTKSRAAWLKELKKVYHTGEGDRAILWKEKIANEPEFKALATTLLWAVRDPKWNDLYRVRLNSEGKCLLLDGSEIDVPDHYQIRLACPVEMKPSEIQSWKVVFANNAIQQPFTQLNETVYDYESLNWEEFSRGDLASHRYSGITILYDSLKEVTDEGFRYSASIDEAESIHIDYDKLYAPLLDRGNYPMEKPRKGARVELRKLVPVSHSTTLSRRINHLIFLMDKVCLKDAIRKHDLSLLKDRAKFLSPANIGECIELAKTEKAEDCLAWLEQQSFGQ